MYAHAYWLFVKLPSKLKMSGSFFGDLCKNYAYLGELTIELVLKLPFLP